ncbi:hypothetical protein HDU81_007977 [Chytriomyces hyalinus]|nr:hypothetical protein HDU81_007977 [Chytriomyces hyalinus]
MFAKTGLPCLTHSLRTARLYSTPATPAASTSLTGRVSGFFSATKETAKLYYNGSKQLFSNSKQAAILVREKRSIELKGGEVSWTRSQFLMVKQTQKDMKKLPPFLFLVLILPESIPFVLMFSPSMIPSTCVSLDQKRKLWTKLKERREATANSWIRQLNEFQSPANLGKEKAGELGWISQVPVAQFRDVSSVLHLAKHAPQYFETSSLERSVMKAMNASLGLTERALLTSSLKSALEKHFEVIREDDVYLAGKVDDVLSLDEMGLIEAAEARGISTMEKTRDEILEDLKWWLNVSVNEEKVRVPTGLMMMANLIRQVKQKE